MIRRHAIPFRVSPVRSCRRWLRFSTRSLLILTALAAAWLGYELHVLRAREAALRRLAAVDLQPMHEAPPRSPREWLAKAAGFTSGKIDPTICWMGYDDRILSPALCRDLACLGRGCFTSVLLMHGQVTDEAVANLAPACNPTTVWLTDNPVTDDCLDTILRFRELETIRLDKTFVTDAGVARLGQLQRLATLDVSGSSQAAAARRSAAAAPVTGRGFAAWPATTPLRWLDANDTAFDDGGAAAISRFANLENVRLVGTRITDQGLGRLAALARLSTLCLDDTQITGHGFAAFMDDSLLDTISLARTDADDEALRYLARFRQLRSLNLSHTHVTAAGLAALAELPMLHVLQLDGCRLTDSSVAALTRYKSLMTLDLSGCEIGDACVESLAKIKTLERLSVNRTGLTPAALACLETALPALEIDHD